MCSGSDGSDEPPLLRESDHFNHDLDTFKCSGLTRIHFNDLQSPLSSDQVGTMMQTPDPVGTIEKFSRVFENCGLLQGLTHDELLACVRHMRTEGFSAGEEILTEGKQYHGLWILLNGTCEVIKRGPQRDSRLATLEPGSVFGEMSFLHPVPHSASVRAVDRVETIRLLKEPYEQLMKDFPAAAQKLNVNIIRILSDRLRKMDEWTAELVERNNNGTDHKEWQDFRSKLYANLFDD